MLSSAFQSWYAYAVMVTYWRRLRPFLRISIKLVGPLLLVYFLATVDLRRIFQTLATTNSWLVLGAILLAVPFFVLKALRWQLVLAIWQIHIPLRLAIPLVCIGQYAGTVTPGQAGDAVRAWYLEQRGYRLEVGLGSVALDRVFDLIVTLFVAVVGLVFYRTLPMQPPRYSLVVGILLLVLAALFVLAVGNVRRRAIYERLPQRLRERLASSPLLKLQLTPLQCCLIGAVSIAALSWTYIRIYLLFMALGISLPIGSFMTFVSLLSLVGSSSPGGVGTRDALLVVVLQTTLGIHRDAAVEQALALSTLILLLNIVNVVIGFGYSLRYRLGGRDRSTHPRW